MGLDETYRKLLADLERELVDIDRDLDALERRREELESWKRIVTEGIEGIKKERITWLK